MVHAPQVLFLRGAGVDDSVVFLDVGSDADGEVVMMLRNGDVEAVTVPVEEFVVAELWKRAVVDLDDCVARAVDLTDKTLEFIESETDDVVEFLRVESDSGGRLDIDLKDGDVGLVMVAVMLDEM